MPDFPVGVAAPEGAQKLVDVCKGTWAVIEDKTSDAGTHNEALDSFEAAVNELNEMGAHVNNEGDFPVFTLGVKDAVCDPSARVAAGAPFLQLSEAVGLSALTNAVDVSEYRTLWRCNLLDLHRAKGASGESPSLLHRLWGKERRGRCLSYGWPALFQGTQSVHEDPCRQR
jgi:hypothetical protein